MSEYGSGGSTLGRLVTWILVALAVIVTLKLTFWMLGLVIGLGALLLFTVGPILLIGWLTVKLYRMATQPG